MADSGVYMKTLILLQASLGNTQLIAGLEKDNNGKLTLAQAQSRHDQAPCFRIVSGALPASIVGLTTKTEAVTAAIGACPGQHVLGAGHTA